MGREHVSNICKKDLLLNPGKYLWLEIEEEYSNVDFSLLLDFIDKYSAYGKEKPYGNAYYRIRMKANQLFGVGKHSPMTLKTSKREIKSIMCSTVSRLNSKVYLKIPYKISYIFKAIIDIVDEIESNGVALPSELAHTVDVAYGIVFYGKYIDTYDSFSEELQDNNRKFVGYRLKAELNNDFHCEDSIFDIPVK